MKFGNRELEIEDDVPRSDDEIVGFANLARMILLQPGVVREDDDEEDDHPREVTSTVQLGFRGSDPVEIEDEEEDEDA